MFNYDEYDKDNYILFMYLLKYNYIILLVIYLFGVSHMIDIIGIQLEA